MWDGFCGSVCVCVSSAMVFIDFQLFSLSICQKVITHTHIHTHS